MIHRHYKVPLHEQAVPKFALNSMLPCMTWDKTCITKQLWDMKSCTVEGHRKALRIAHNPNVLGWAHWEGWLLAARCREHNTHTHLWDCAAINQFSQHAHPNSIGLWVICNAFLCTETVLFFMAHSSYFFQIAKLYLQRWTTKKWTTIFVHFWTILWLRKSGTRI